MSRYEIQVRDEAEAQGVDSDGPSVEWRIREVGGGTVARSRVAYWSEEEAAEAARRALAGLQGRASNGWETMPTRR